MIVQIGNSSVFLLFSLQYGVCVHVYAYIHVCRLCMYVMCLCNYVWMNIYIKVVTFELTFNYYLICQVSC